MGSKRKQKKTIKSQFSYNWLNKYTIAALALMGWLCFFDSHNVFTQYELGETVEKLENEKKDYLVKLEEAKIERENLNNNIEKFAREKYFMHKDNEEVFIIEKKK